MSLATSRRDFVRLAAGAAAASVLPGVAPRTPGAAGPPRVLVLGAGLAGLQAALLLEQQGFVVSVLEGQARVGGRLLTLADLPGTPEAGGQILGRSYVRLRATAERVGVRLKTAAFGHGPKSGQCADCHVQGKVPDRTGGPGALVYRKGRLMREADWADAADDLSTEERSVAPTRLLASYLGRLNPLSDAAAWTRYEHAPLDALSLEAYLKQLGASPGALEIMDVAPNCPGLARASALWALRDSRRRMDALGGVPLDFPAGASAFAATLAAALRSPVETGRVVRAIRITADGVAVRCADGTHHEAAFAIATLPLPALARLEIDPPLEPVQARAVREIGYTPITRVFCEVLRPFWEADGLPVTTWTDTPIERVFPLRDEAGAVAGLSVFVDGANAERLDALAADERHRFVESELARVRPATQGAVRARRSVSWAQDPFAGGAYPWFAPGQIVELWPALARPHGRLHFAGEHTAVTQPGMEGACESAERAVAEIVARAGVA